MGAKLVYDKYIFQALSDNRETIDFYLMKLENINTEQLAAFANNILQKLAANSIKVEV